MKKLNAASSTSETTLKVTGGRVLRLREAGVREIALSTERLASSAAQSREASEPGTSTVSTRRVTRVQRISRVERPFRTSLGSEQVVSELHWFPADRPGSFMLSGGGGAIGLN